MSSKPAIIFDLSYLARAQIFQNLPPPILPDFVGRRHHIPLRSPFRRGRTGRRGGADDSVLFQRKSHLIALDWKSNVEQHLSGESSFQPFWHPPHIRLLSWIALLSSIHHMADPSVHGCALALSLLGRPLMTSSSLPVIGLERPVQLFAHDAPALCHVGQEQEGHIPQLEIRLDSCQTPIISPNVDSSVSCLQKPLGYRGADRGT